jgi:hypothetical protein
MCYQSIMESASFLIGPVSCPNNITFCSRAPGCATEEQAKQLNIYMRGESNT